MVRGQGLRVQFELGFPSRSCLAVLGLGSRKLRSIMPPCNSQSAHNPRCVYRIDWGHEEIVRAKILQVLLKTPREAADVQPQASDVGALTRMPFAVY